MNSDHEGHSAPKAASPPPRKEDIKTPTHGDMSMADLDEPRPEVTKLQRLRLLQATLKPVFEMELAAQRQHDASAQKLMERDPEGHIEMMRMPQEHAALARELPAQILREEAKLYTLLAPGLEADRAKILQEPGVVMAGHIGTERWTQAALLSLGLWLAASPFALGYRSVTLLWNDVAAGLLVIALATFALSGRRWAPWANCLVGLWVMFAPLAFWAPDAAAYANETLVGALIVTFSILVPMRMKMDGSDIPVGWTYSPSSWLQRAPTIALAFLAFYLSRYLAAFQLGHIQSVWDPFFGDGTRRVLTSEVSRAFPISDAGLGAYAYMIEILSGFMGDARRWRTMPWMVALFGIAVVPLGIISTVLIILQPLAVGAWCSFCLISGALMLVMVALSLDEIVAMIQFLVQSKREGHSVWRTFWVGGNAPVRLKDDILLARPEGGGWRQMVWGTNVPWNLLCVSLAGIWLMMAPAAFLSASPAAHADHLLGALVVVVAAIAMAEVGRAARFLNIILALGIIAAPWVLTGASTLARWNDLVAGLIVIGLSLRRGPIRERYGSWNRYIA
ncbi:MAG: vitamin K epoxide reductase family protein [Thermoanaerobaculia bacterium]